MKIKKLLVALSSIFFLAGCQNFALDKLTNSENILKEDASSDSTSEEVTSTTTYTVLVYMCGSDLESENSLATLNIDEMCSLNLNNNINLILETGGAKKWNESYPISSTEIGRYKVENKQLTKIESKEIANMGDANTLSDFVSWGISQYPADKTALVLWNHGGAMYGVCFDENYNNALLNSEVYSALESALNNQKLEWVGYDACLMQVQDIAEYNSNFANYMVASQETEPGPGWDWDVWLDALNSNMNISTTDLLTSITNSYVDKVRAYYDDYVAACELTLEQALEAGDSNIEFEDGTTMNIEEFQNYIKYYKENNDATCSVLDLSKMDEYKVSFDSMSSYLTSKITTSDKFLEVYKDAEGFINSDTYKCYDADDVLNFINTNYPESKADEVLDKLEGLVIYNRVGNVHANACGLSIYCGSINSRETNFTTWQTFTNL